MSKEMITKYYDLDFNGTPIQACIDKLIEVKQLLDAEGVVYVDEYGSIYLKYEVEETDAEYSNRIAREAAMRAYILTKKEQKTRIAELEQTVQQLTKQLNEQAFPTWETSRDAVE